MVYPLTCFAYSLSKHVEFMTHRCPNVYRIFSLIDDDMMLLSLLLYLPRVSSVIERLSA